MAATMVAGRLTREQQRAKDGLLAGLDHKQVQRLGGFAGTGKTHLLRDLYREISLGRGWRVGVCAPTGKAANVLRRNGLGHALTMHSLAYRCGGVRKEMAWEEDEHGNRVEVVKREHPLFVRKEAVAFDALIIDEASMVNRTHFEDLCSFQVPLVFVGDHGQLPPVGQQQVHLMREPDFRLETVHRNAGPIARFCEWARHGKLPRHWPGDSPQVQVFRHDVELDPAWLDSQVICGLNRTRVGINAAFRGHLGRTLPVEPGDRVVSLRNCPGKNLWNGTQGVVRDVVSCDEMVLDIDGRLVATSYDPDTFGREHPVGVMEARPHPYDYAYAVTCHKVQGDQFPAVTVIDESAFMGRDNPDNVRRWRYTAASRARQVLRWVC